MSDTHPLIVIIGPTAAGKSARAMALAPRVGGEIISADSRHVYRRMDIGTNKPTPIEQALVRHHLLDIRDPHESFSLAEYTALARAAITDVRLRGKVPMLVGGTGQYVRAVLEGWQAPAVPPHPEIRKRWLALAAEQDGHALEAALLARDPAALQTIDSRNVRRMIRALEVMEVTGRRWSDLQQRQPLDPGGVQIIYVNLPREELYARADARLADMLGRGWLDEVRRLLAELAERGITAGAALRLPSMSALGYRELVGVIQGQLTLDEAVTHIKRETRRFIRAQDTWFRKIAGVG
ncbi:MAG: tRNA (adenosine(37)-N6)-dimethylallyltransferase MiaA [Chloroflexi bacterium]|nr:tRNA (adenosine(37)-N6)-dimethylallyltransferase MiaA [Chloroflexota bacterium]MCL5275562.1 tRNA (adenosine(37)-N6)-dimethylallyltransferase MiaA [Chloroflexota bacterium]